MEKRLLLNRTAKLTNNEGKAILRTQKRDAASQPAEGAKWLPTDAEKLDHSHKQLNDIKEEAAQNDKKHSPAQRELQALKPQEEDLKQREENLTRWEA